MLDQLLNPKYLKRLYPNGLSFNNCFISELNFSYNGPSVGITFHMDQLPSNLPFKWPKSFNKVKLILEFIEITNLSFAKWGTFNVVELKLEIKENLRTITLNGKDCQLSFNAKWINFKSIDPYLDE